MYYIILQALHDITAITSITLHYLVLHTFTYYYTDYMTLLLLHDITFHYRWSQPGSASSGPAPAPPRAPTSPASCPLRRPISVARQIMCCARRWPIAYNKAAAAWRAKFPLAALQDPRKDFLVCEGGQRTNRTHEGPRQLFQVICRVHGRVASRRHII